MTNDKSDTNKLNSFVYSSFWFLIGFGLTAIFLVSFIMIILDYFYRDKVHEGIYAANINLGGKTKEEVKNIFDQKNSLIKNSTFTIYEHEKVATVSAEQIDLGYNAKLIAEQAASVGKTQSILTNFYLTALAYSNGLNLSPSYSISENKLEKKLENFQNDIYIEPQDALFKVSENKKVVVFRESVNGKTIDFDALDKILKAKIEEIIKDNKNSNVIIPLPLKTLKPNKTTEEANNLGIVEAIGRGISYYKGSIPNRIYNINLAASKINGILIAPDETFSFNRALGDVSKFTGYKEAYIIQNGKTILGDGGGVCQVSTTLFRAILDSGLPITERRAHAYRVGYYEQNSKPGIDATVYSPIVDFKFKNDMKNYILIQAFIGPEVSSLSFVIYGKKDGRTVEITTPVIKNQTPPPPVEYQDDPALPKGTVKQIDYEAWGADTIFTRKVFKHNQLIIDETFSSHYAPWRAVYLRGTKEG